LRTTVAFDAGSLRLAGEVFMPEDAGPFPALVFVHGSGEATRADWEDEARFLVEEGIAALAYDKPGCGESAGDWTRQSFDERATEALAALRFLQRLPGIDPASVGLLGASQGAWVAPMAAAASGDVSFVVAASASGVPPREQDRFRVEEALRGGGFSGEEVDRALASWDERDRRLEQGEPAPAILAAERRVRQQPWYSVLDFGEPEILDFVRRNWKFDPVPYLKRCRCPMLAVWGAGDAIVPVERSRAIFEAVLGARAELVVLPGSDHHLRADEDAPWGSVALPLIADWVRSRTRPEPAPGAVRS
jgi:dipeptidyl aminopeptidase/acylaminoacyl peptidase